MQLIGTFSLTRRVQDWFRNSNRPRILHVFDRACNLVNEHGEVLAIVTPQIGNGPFNLVIEDIVRFSNDLHVESPISISGNQLILGDFTIDIADTELWDPRPDWERLPKDRDPIISQANKILVPDLQLPNALISSLTFSIAHGDLSTAKSAASKLAGLGIGLTPSGDDFMMGALYATRIIHPPEIARMLAEGIADTAASLTTSLSAEWLRAAARGEAGILWHQFLDALTSSDPNQIQSTADDVVAVGATSGADALAGFIGTLIAYTELEQKHVISKFI